jgi:Tol biopolymer transport system component
MNRRKKLLRGIGLARGHAPTACRLSTAALGALLLAAPAVGQETERVSVDSSGSEANSLSDFASISADGQIVAFDSLATNLVAGDTNGTRDVFVHDRTTGITERVSVDSSGTEANGASSRPSISADGQLVAFGSNASNLVAGFSGGVFVKNRTTGIVEIVSVDSSGVAGNGGGSAAAISADGNVVAFQSTSTNLVAGDTNGLQDIFVHDRTTGVTERVSVTALGVQADADCFAPSISSDGQFVVFETNATNLVAGDVNGKSDIFYMDRNTGILQRVSVDSSGAEANGDSIQASISADGQLVAFASLASNLVAGDTNTTRDIFVRDLSALTTELVSVDSSGAQANEGSSVPSISADGQTVAFNSTASNLVAGDTNGFQDIFVHGRPSGITERVSVDSSGAEGNDMSRDASISADGQVVAFSSFATNLVASDINASVDIFTRHRCDVDATWTNYGNGFPGTNGVPSFTSRTDPVLGTRVTLDLANSLGNYTFGLVFIGFQRTQIHSSWGGDLLVVPAVTILIVLGPTGWTISDDLPSDDALCGFLVDLQAIESDRGAAKGVSFTPGLELALGH